MFTIKFIMGEAYTHMACNHYSVSVLPCGAKEVVVYPGLTSQDGIAYNVTSEHSSDDSGEPKKYDAAFVMNQQGDTIDRIR